MHLRFNLWICFTAFHVWKHSSTGDLVGTVLSDLLIHTEVADGHDCVHSVNVNQNILENII